MANICIPAKAAKAFGEALKSKDIKVDDLLKMSTEDRTKVFESFAGDQAKAINTLFEEKLVLKNQMLGLKNFVAKVAQEGKYDPAKKAELEQLASEFRQKQQERIFSPSEKQAFLNDLADATVGAHVTRAEANTVFELSSKVDTLLEKYDGKEWSSPEAKREYGDAKYAYEAYTDALKAGDTSLKTLVKEALASFKEKFKTDPPKAVIDLILKAAKGATDTSIATVASLDDSFIGRQGLLTLFTEPKRYLQAKAKGIPYKNIWWDGTHHSFTDFYKTFKGFDQKAVLMSELYSQPNYINGDYHTAKLLPKNEEQYPTSVPERVPGLGRVFKGSQAAFEGSALRMRTQLYDFTSELMKKNGVDMTDKAQIQSVGKLVNSMTSRGSLGDRGGSSLTRLVLWAPKMLKAHWDVLTAHTGQEMSPAAKKEAALNLVSLVATTAAIMTIANTLKPGSAQTDPRSADFGKIKIGNTRFDYTGGAASLAVLASRLVSLSTKNSQGVVEKLNTGSIVGQTGFDVLADFAIGKTTPAAGAAIALLLKGTDYKGDKATVGGQLYNASVPITLQNAISLKDDHSVSAVTGVLLDALGVNASTYSPHKTDWTQNPGAELEAFQKKVGDQKFKAANDAYDTQLDAFTTSLADNAKYKALSDEDKTRVLDKKKADIKAAIFQKNGFIYKRATPSKVPKV